MHKPALAAFMVLLGSHAAAAAATCTLPDVADKVDLKQLHGSNLVTVPVAINGVPKQFLLDIGTKPTRISQAAVTQLGLPEATRATENIDAPRFSGDLNFGSSSVQATVRQAGSGTNQDMFGARVRLGSFTIGDATGKNLMFMIAKDGEIAKDAPYDGLLTNDFFKQYDVEIDFGTMQMFWLTPTGCTDPAQVAGAPSFAAFADRCLYDPDTGYYSTGEVRFGFDGHFWTYPQRMSPLFGWLS